jgi:hypothetical protein
MKELSVLFLVICTAVFCQVLVVSGENAADTPQYNLTDNFIPSGYMGDIEALKVIPGYMEPTNNTNGASEVSIQFTYTPTFTTRGNKWVGIYWQNKDGNWGDFPGENLTGYSRLEFRAKGDKGNEVAEFKFGGINDAGKTYHDSVTKALTTGPVGLGKQWKSYSIDLKGKDLSSVIGGFCAVFNEDNNPSGCVVYVDKVILK